MLLFDNIITVTSRLY